MKRKTNEKDPILRRLDAIIALLAQEKAKSLGEKMVALSDAGLRPVEVSRILGKSVSHVTKELAIARKKTKTSKRKGASH